MQLIEVVDFTAAKAVTIIIHIHVRRDTHDTQERTWQKGQNYRYHPRFDEANDFANLG